LASEKLWNGTRIDGHGPSIPSLAKGIATNVFQSARARQRLPFPANDSTVEGMAASCCPANWQKATSQRDRERLIRGRPPHSAPVLSKAKRVGSQGTTAHSPSDRELRLLGEIQRRKERNDVRLHGRHFTRSNHIVGEESFPHEDRIRLAQVASAAKVDRWV
jgi:hypothetical protein